MTDDGITRRQFLTGSVVAGATLYVANASHAAGAARRPRSMVSRVSLGKTRLRPSYLAFGTGTKGWEKQSNQTRLGREPFIRLLQHAWDRGIRFFDCADIYGTHDYVREALRGKNRADYVLQSKTWWRTSKGIREDVDRFRRELGTDYIDLLHLHAVEAGTWPQDLRPAMEVLAKAKDEGAIRACGLSIHHFDALQAAATEPWVDVAVCRVNHTGQRMDAEPARVAPVLGQIRDAGKGVVAIKILAEGDIAAQREQSLRYVLGLDCVHAMVIGFESPQQVDEIIAIGNRILAGK